MSEFEIVRFVEARLAEDDATAHEGPHTVWQLEHEGYGVSLHAMDAHAKATAERREPAGETYWRWDDGDYWLKRHGETVATIRRVQVLGPAPARVLADIAAKCHLLEWCVEVLRGVDLTHMNEDGWLRNDPHARATHTAVLALCTMAAPYADHPDFRPAWRIG